MFTPDVLDSFYDDYIFEQQNLICNETEYFKGVDLYSLIRSFKDGLPKIFAISGKMGTGKDFLSNQLHKALHKLRYKAMILSFADQIKIDLLSRNIKKYDEIFTQDRTFETRQLLKDYAQEMRDKHGFDYWIKNLENWIKVHHSRGIEYFIISDLRFKNEAKWVEEQQGLTIRIQAPKRNLIRATKEANCEDKNLIPKRIETLLNHPSEIDLDDYPFACIVDNDF